MGRSIKWLLDKILSLFALIVLSPLMLIAAVGIKISSPGPVFYKAKRMGKDMVPFDIYKFRSMHVGASRQGAITGTNDSRVFRWGAVLRKTKVDELPQLVNILKGDMSIIGPRPEDVDIVQRAYTEEQKKTLSVLPGLACPGSIFSYTHGDLYLSGEDPEEDYIRKFLPVKLSLDQYYLDHWTLSYDVSIVFRTLKAIFETTFGRKQLPPPPEFIALYGSDVTVNP